MNFRNFSNLINQTLICEFVTQPPQEPPDSEIDETLSRLDGTVPRLDGTLDPEIYGILVQVFNGAPLDEVVLKTNLHAG